MTRISWSMLLILLVASVAVTTHAQSKFSVDASNIRLETSPPKSTTSDGARSDRKADSLKGLFKDVRPGACRAQASPLVPSSSWPARGEPAITVCRP
ncbi:MAG TPA: hypothetical protein VFB85_04660 [Vicinamibacterales bacterium]|nr:hypothetical protein [Vicinamibacterales bacterium]